MAEVLQDLLNNADARKSDTVQARMVEESSAGTPWFNG
jgi:hypothetical protein